ncbi:MAG: hypothetical protein AAGI52_15745 [Bacteroidota bacterium]
MLTHIRRAAYALALAALTITPTLAETPLCDCLWASSGCIRYALVDPNPAGATADVFVNCGNGWMYQGSGPYGGCPGSETCWGGYA